MAQPEGLGNEIFDSRRAKGLAIITNITGGVFNCVPLVEGNCQAFGPQNLNVSWCQPFRLG